MTATPPSDPTPPPDRLPRAVLWDMDGTLVDSEPFWMEAETDLVHHFGGTWTHEDALSLVGNGLHTSAEILQGRGVPLSTDEIVRTLVDAVIARLQREIPWRPGARELLHELRELGVPTALVTMSTGNLAREVVAAMGFTAFDTIVSYDDVSAPKPHPEPYLLALDRLGLDADGCVAIEDSVPGVTSAVSAGLTTIAVPFHVPIPPSNAFVTWSTLADRRVLDLAELALPARAARA